MDLKSAYHAADAWSPRSGSCFQIRLHSWRSRCRVATRFVRDREGLGSHASAQA